MKTGVQCVTMVQSAQQLSEMNRRTCRLTSQQDPSEHCVVAFQCAAVPAVVSELVLALSDPLLRALADGLHDVWVALAQLPLLVDQGWDVVTDHTGTQSTDVPGDTARRCESAPLNPGGD